MSENKNGGSDSNASPPPANPAGDGVKNKTAKMVMDAIVAENASLKLQATEKDALIAALKKESDEANAVLDAKEREKKIAYLLPRTSAKHDVLAAKTQEQLDDMIATVDMAILPKLNSVRFGVQAADVSDREMGFTVGDLSVVTAKKREAARGAA